MKNLRVQVCSDVAYEKLIAEIYFDDRFVALISQEEPSGQLVVEFPGPEQDQNAITRKVDLVWLRNALDEAERDLAGRSGSE